MSGFDGAKIEKYNMTVELKLVEGKYQVVLKQKLVGNEQAEEETKTVTLNPKYPLAADEELVISLNGGDYASIRTDGKGGYKLYNSIGYNQEVTEIIDGGKIESESFSPGFKYNRIAVYEVGGNRYEEKVPDSIIELKIGENGNPIIVLENQSHILEEAKKREIDLSKYIKDNLLYTENGIKQGYNITFDNHQFYVYVNGKQGNEYEIVNLSRNNDDERFNPLVTKVDREEKYVIKSEHSQGNIESLWLYNQAKTQIHAKLEKQGDEYRLVVTDENMVSGEREEKSILLSEYEELHKEGKFLVMPLIKFRNKGLDLAIVKINENNEPELFHVSSNVQMIAGKDEPIVNINIVGQGEFSVSIDDMNVQSLVHENPAIDEQQEIDLNKEIQAFKQRKAALQHEENRGVGARSASSQARVPAQEIKPDNPVLPSDGDNRGTNLEPTNDKKDEPILKPSKQNQEKTSITVELKLDPKGEDKLLLEEKDLSGKTVKSQEIKLSEFDFSNGKKLQVNLVCDTEYLRTAVVGFKDGKYELFSCDMPMCAADAKAKLETQQGSFSIADDKIKGASLIDQAPYNFEEKLKLADFSKFVNLLIGEGQNPGRIGFASKLEQEKQGAVKDQFKQKLTAALQEFASGNDKFAGFMAKEDNLAAKEQLASDVMRELYKSGELENYGKFKNLGSSANLLTRLVEAVSAVINRVFGDGKIYQEWSEGRTKFEVKELEAGGKNISSAIDAGFNARKEQFGKLFADIAAKSQGNALGS